MDVPYLGENSFLITIFFLSGCSTCTLRCVPKCQNVFLFSHNVHLKIRIKDVNGKFECEPNKVYKGHVRRTSHSIRVNFSHLILKIWKGQHNFVSSCLYILCIPHDKPIVDCFILGTSSQRQQLSSLWKLFNWKKKIDQVIWFSHEKSLPLSRCISLVFLKASFIVL